MKYFTTLLLLGIICTVNYPSDCTIVSTKFGGNDKHFKAQVECSYEDGSRSLYWTTANRPNTNKAARVDYLPSVQLTDSITMTCQ